MARRRHGLTRVSTAAWVVLFAGYAWIVSTLCAAWYLRRMASGRGEDLALGTSLVWQGTNYAVWFAAAGIVWLILRRLGAGAASAALCWAAGLMIVPLAALGSVGIDLAFGLGRADETWGRAVDRAPVAILLYTAVVCVGFAAVHRQKAVEARDRARSLEAALAAARSAAERSAAPARLMVSTGARRAPVDVADVEWFAAAGNYVVVHWAEREGLMRETLRALEARLDPTVFARSHRSTLVNLARVQAVQLLSDGSWRLTMLSGADLIISRSCRDDILARLGR
ncbi:MAG: hypothetical protein RL093_921 [Pseudomonadota bacterium]